MVIPGGRLVVSGVCSDVVFRQLIRDAELADGAGPGGHCGATQESSAADSHPLIDTSDQPLPGPAATTLRRLTEATKDLVANVS